MQKRIVSCILAMCLVLVSVYADSYAENAQNRKLVELQAFGIIKSVDMSPEHMSEDITRAEFITIVLRMIRQEDLGFGELDSIYSDVSPNAWYAENVSTSTYLGIVSGYEDGTFRPLDGVTLHEAAKVMTTALGYEVVAASNGGYPKGYLLTAHNIGLLKGVAASEKLSRMDVYTMAYNALDINMMQKVFDGIGGYKVDQGNTLRNFYSDLKDEGVERKTGVVEANYYIYLGEPISTIRENQVMIDGVIYDVGDTTASDYIGQSVEFYVNVGDGTSRPVIVGIRATNDTNVWEVSHAEFESFSNGKLYYYLEDEQRERHISVSDNLRLIKNGIPQEVYSESDITVNSGFLVLIDNDGDEVVDVIMSQEYQHFKVDEILNSRIIFEEPSLLHGKSFLQFDTEDRERKFIIKNSNGEKADFDEIQADSVVSIMADEFDTLYIIIINDEIVEGKIEGVESTQEEQVVVINGERYKLSEDAWRDVILGDEVKGFLNIFGEIISFETITTENRYAYIVKTSAIYENGKYVQKGIKNAEVQLLIPGTLAVEYDIDDTDPDNIKRTPYIKGRNSTVEVYEVSERVLKSGLPLGKPVKYELDSKGVIIRFDEVELPKGHSESNSNSTRRYNGYDRVFGGSNIGIFGTDDSTRIICVPTNDVTGNLDYYAMVDITNNGNYAINGYEIDDSGIAKLAVVRMEMKAENVIDPNSKLAIVSRVKRVVDENGDEVTDLEFMEEGSKKQYKISSAAEEKVQAMSFGDVFYYSLNPLEEIGNIKVVKSFGQKPSFDNQGQFETEKIMFGRIINSKYKQLSDRDNMYVDQHLISFATDDSETYSLSIGHRNPPSIYIVNMRSKTVTSGTSMDLNPAHSSVKEYIFVHVKESDIKGIVIYRY